MMGRPGVGEVPPVDAWLDTVEPAWSQAQVEGRLRVAGGYQRSRYGGGYRQLGGRHVVVHVRLDYEHYRRVVRERKRLDLRGAVFPVRLE